MSKKEKSELRAEKTEKRRENLARRCGIILGIKVNSSTKEEALNSIKNVIVQKRRILVVTPNPEIAVLAQADPVLSSILNSADFSLPDGVGLVWASRWLNFKSRVLPRVIPPASARPSTSLRTARVSGSLPPASPADALHFSKRFSSPLNERVSGVDVMESLVKMAAERGWRVFLLGGRAGVAEKAAKSLIVNHQSLIISHDSGPRLNTDSEPVNGAERRKEAEVIKKINEFHPELLFVGFGAPKQEKWIARHLPKLNVNCAMVVGGALDVVSGRVPRAPGWIRNIGFEWLFRLLVEPARWRRQLALFKFAFLVLKS